MTVIDFHLRCAKCDSDLAGLPLSARCPQYGLPASSTINVKLIETESATVATDAFCLNCSYNLRTLPINAVCPECGTPVADAIRADDLQHASWDWRQRLQDGIGSLLIAAIGLPLTLLAIYLTALFTVGRTARIGLFGFVFAFAMILVFAWLGVAGVIGIAWHKPHPRFARCSPWPGRLAVACPLLLVPTVVVLGLLAMFGVVFPELGYLGLGAIIILLVSLPTSGVGVILLLGRLAVLARRPDWARSCRSWAWIAAAGGASIVLSWSFELVAFFTRGRYAVSSGPEWARLFGWIGAVPATLAYLATIVILIRIRRLFADLPQTRDGLPQTQSANDAAASSPRSDGSRPMANASEGENAHD